MPTPTLAATESLTKKQEPSRPAYYEQLCKKKENGTITVQELMRWRRGKVFCKQFENDA